MRDLSSQFVDRLNLQSAKARRANVRLVARQQLRTRRGKQIPRRTKVVV
jgi:hypothetical protein